MLPKTVLNGQIHFSGGEPFDGNLHLRLNRSGVDPDHGILIRCDRQVPVTAGSFSVELWPTARVEGLHYIAELPDQPLGTFDLPEDGPIDLVGILET